MKTPTRETMLAQIDRTLIYFDPSEECGRPEELWRIGSLEVVMHLEDNGDGHIIIDAGDWELEREVTTTGIEDLRQQAFAMVDALLVEA